MKLLKSNGIFLAKRTEMSPVKKSLWTGGFVLILGVIALLDFVTGVEVSFSVFYLVPISLATWAGGLVYGLLFGALSAITWLVLDLAGGTVYTDTIVPFWNAGVRFGFFSTCVLLLARVRYLTDSLEDLVQERTAQLKGEIKRREMLEAEAAEITRREQEKLAFELHDQIGAYLAGLAFRARIVAESIPPEKIDDRKMANEVVRAISSAITQVRGFARALAPMETDLSLPLVLEHLADEITNVYEVNCKVKIATLPAMNFDTVRHLLRIAQEATRNAIKHGKAKEIEINVTYENQVCCLIVKNDGAMWNDTPEVEKSLGLRSMKHRAHALGGSFTIARSREGGAEIKCEIPLAAPKSGEERKKLAA